MVKLCVYPMDHMKKHHITTIKFMIVKMKSSYHTTLDKI